MNYPLTIPLNSWLGDIRDLQGNAQVTNYLAIQNEIRKSMDDWVAIEKFERFESLMNKLGLSYVPESIFEPLDPNSPPNGLSIAPTTHAKGRVFERNLLSKLKPGATVHVTIAKTKIGAEDAAIHAWYPLAINNRICQKPLIDHVRLGRAFGYPECCIQHFLHHNSWGVHNSIVDSANKTVSFSWYTNSFFRYTPWMLNFHGPCSFDCKNSKAMGADLFNLLNKLEADYATMLKSYNRSTILTFSEYLTFAFTGANLENCMLHYEDVEMFSTSAIGLDQRARYILKILKAANSIVADEHLIKVYNNKKLIRHIRPQFKANVLEIPRLINFQ